MTTAKAAQNAREVTKRVIHALAADELRSFWEMARPLLKENNDEVKRT